MRCERDFANEITPRYVLKVLMRGMWIALCIKKMAC